MVPAKYKQYIISHLLKADPFSVLLNASFSEGSILIVINLIMILEKALEFLQTDVNFFFYCFLITDQTFG